jgi:hypothetical protein
VEATRAAAPAGRAALIDPDRLDQVLGAWLRTSAAQVSGRLVIAVLGKAVRGARNKDGKARTWSWRWRTASAAVGRAAGRHGFRGSS